MKSNYDFSRARRGVVVPASGSKGRVPIRLDRDVVGWFGSQVNDAVIDFHFDPIIEDMKSPDWLASPPNPPVLRANLSAFERLLEHNRKAKIGWGHAGSDMLGQ